MYRGSERAGVEDQVRRQIVEPSQSTSCAEYSTVFVEYGDANSLSFLSSPSLSAARLSLYQHNATNVTASTILMNSPRQILSNTDSQWTGVSPQPQPAFPIEVQVSTAAVSSGLYINGIGADSVHHAIDRRTSFALPASKNQNISLPYELVLESVPYKCRADTQVKFRLLLYHKPEQMSHSDEIQDFMEGSSSASLRLVTRFKQLYILKGGRHKHACIEDASTIRLFITVLGAVSWNEVSCCDSCQRRESAKSTKEAKSRTRTKVALTSSDLESPVACPSRNHIPFSTGETYIAFRITCYSRHHRSEGAFRVFLEAEDSNGTLLAQTTTEPIVITDDHKQTNQRQATHRYISNAGERQSLPISHGERGNGSLGSDRMSSFFTPDPSAPLSTPKPRTSTSANPSSFAEHSIHLEADHINVNPTLSAMLPYPRPLHSKPSVGYLASTPLEQPLPDLPDMNIDRYSATVESYAVTAPPGVSNPHDGHAAVEGAEFLTLINHLSASLEEESDPLWRAHGVRQPFRVSESYQRMLDSMSQPAGVTSILARSPIPPKAPLGTERYPQQSYKSASYSRSSQAQRVRSRVNAGGPQVNW